MLSARGAITTRVAMVECAAGQNMASKDLFLLSELEKVWLALAQLVRRMLLGGKGVQVPNFGSFHTEERLLAVDAHRRRYCTRELHFRINTQFATRYGVDTVKVPPEKPETMCAKVHVAEVVALCGVPARTAQVALREFFLYVGEGLHQGRVFQLSFPDVVTLTMKKERVMLTVEDKLRDDLFDLDARRWPSEMREHCRDVLTASQPSRPGTAASASRPSSRLSCASWRRETPSEPRRVFTSAFPSGRLFEDIAKDAHRRRELERAAAQSANALDVATGVESHGPIVCAPVHASHPRESVYNLVTPSSSARTQHERRLSDDDDKEDDATTAEVEAVEELTPEPPATAPPARPLGAKNSELEALLRREEPFTRPISRQVCHEGNRARDLIYGRPPTARAESDPHPDDTAAATAHYGRKRFDHRDGAMEMGRLRDLLKLPPA